MSRECCTFFMSRGNSARSLTTEVLGQDTYFTGGLCPKHWREFSNPVSLVFEFVFKLSDIACRDKLPDWSGKPASSHWHYPDPRKRFARTLSALKPQMRVFVQRPLETLDAIALHLAKAVDEIGYEHSTSTAEASGGA